MFVDAASILGGRLTKMAVPRIPAMLVGSAVFLHSLGQRASDEPGRGRGAKRAQFIVPLSDFLGLPQAWRITEAGIEQAAIQPLGQHCGPRIVPPAQNLAKISL